MTSIAFIDTEIDPKSQQILDIGSVRFDGGSFHNASVLGFIRFLGGVQYICGHNILNHDIKYIGKALTDAGVKPTNIIDTLFLSPLLFPTKPYHALLKDDKLQSEETNNPLNDSIKARDLFFDEVAAFKQTDETLKQIFYLLLNDKKEFLSFFQFIAYTTERKEPGRLISEKFENEICEQVDLTKLISDHPIELAYCLSLINSFIYHKRVHSITPPWVLKNYPEVERIMFLLRNKPCISGCAYCNKALDIHKGLKRLFGFDSFRTYGGEPLQEKAVKAAVDNKSFLAVFPTGGGKSITFQIPALMSGDSVNGLTVVISPLQSLMKDQVDNLENAGITKAVTINGLLDPIERAKSFERVEDGSASILYISPESLRSRTIERLILGRKIVRFVIDEAHCFSSWGQDFRVDYLYIGDFINSIQEKKNLEDGIPVSCFTATAKQKVIEDIRDYFKEKLSIELELFASKTSRTNLQYKVFEKGDEEEKYQTVRELIEEKNCPTIIYVSRTRKAYLLAERLTQDGFNARPYHGKMDVKEKTANQDAFISGEVPTMVATSAFGMGVDKKDVGMVIHYEISDSLENYIQEAGRAGRDENIVADCFVLFNEEDLGKHFILLNQTKLSIKEIQQIWKAIKEITRFRSNVSNSALEIARKAGWDDNVVEIETRVTTAIAALEDAGYLKRGQNMPRVFANSILSKNAQEAIDTIYNSDRFEERQKEKGIRIIKKLFSSKSNLVDFTNQFVKRIRHRLKDTPIISKQTDNGKIKLVRYQSGNLITPLVHDIFTSGLTGTICVLTKTNEEALQITGLLLKSGMQAKLIQTNEGFSLYNLSEVRFFLSQLNLANDVFIISDDVWAAAKRKLMHTFCNSNKLDVCNNIIKDFEATNPKKKYKSDLEVFIRESRLEDFYNDNGETIFVSTIHKAKGKEFDHVFLMLDNFNSTTDEARRQLYVAMTRAKQNLTVHLNSTVLDNLSVENLEQVEDSEMYLPPNELAMHLTYKDVWLDYFINKQHLVSQLTSGDVLTLNGNACLNPKGQSVLKFSMQFVDQIESMKQRNFELKSAKVNFIVYWMKEGAEREVKIILPELCFERQ